MSTRTRWFSLIVILVTLVPVQAGAAEPAAGLVAAASAAGMQIDEDQIFTLSRGKDVFIAAPSVAWARIPPSELSRGTTFGIAYVDSKTLNVPRGYYVLRAFADASRTGSVDGKVQFLDSKGKVVAERPAVVRIHSLTVPANAKGRNFITTSNRTVGEHVDAAMFIWFHCINGCCIDMSL